VRMLFEQEKYVNHRCCKKRRQIVGVDVCVCVCGVARPVLERDVGIMGMMELIRHQSTGAMDGWMR
jgi:hypothetical protein